MVRIRSRVLRDLRDLDSTNVKRLFFGNVPSRKVGQTTWVGVIYVMLLPRKMLSNSHWYTNLDGDAWICKSCGHTVVPSPFAENTPKHTLLYEITLLYGRTDFNQTQKYY